MILKITTVDQLRKVINVVYNMELDVPDPGLDLWTYGDLVKFFFADKIKEDMKAEFVAAAERQSELAARHMACGLPGDDMTELDGACEDLDGLLEYVQLPVYVAIAPGPEVPHVEFSWDQDMVFDMDRFEKELESAEIRLYDYEEDE